MLRKQLISDLISILSGFITLIVAPKTPTPKSEILHCNYTFKMIYYTAVRLS